MQPRMAWTLHLYAMYAYIHGWKVILHIICACLLAVTCHESGLEFSAHNVMAVRGKFAFQSV